MRHACPTCTDQVYQRQLIYCDWPQNPPAQHCLGAPYAGKTALTCQGMDSTCSGIWHQHINSDPLSPACCEVGPQWIRLVWAAHPTEA